MVRAAPWRPSSPPSPPRSFALIRSDSVGLEPRLSQRSWRKNATGKGAGSAADLAVSAFPVGAFAYSHGLEAAVDQVGSGSSNIEA